MEKKEDLFEKSFSIVSSIDSFNNWIFKLNDKEFANQYRNDIKSGSVSDDRLYSLEMYDKFLALESKFYEIKEGIFNFPDSFFSKDSLMAQMEIKRIEIKKDKIVEALNREHINSTEAVLTIRNLMRDYYKILKIILTDLYEDMRTLSDKNNKLKNLIKEEKKRVEYNKKARNDFKSLFKTLEVGDQKSLKKFNEKIKFSKKKIKLYKKILKTMKSDLHLQKGIVGRGIIKEKARKFLDYLNYLNHIDNNLTKIENKS